jgi:hypothetical protein
MSLGLQLLSAMNNEYEIIGRLTSSQICGSEKNRLLNDFAEALGWDLRPALIQR